MGNVIVLLTIAISFMFTCTYSVAGVTNNPPVRGASEDFNLSDYIIGPADKLEIKVYRNDDLSFTQQVDPSGKISYPLLGDIQVAGMTVYAVRTKIAEGLSRYLKDPQVIINMAAYTSNKVTILGAITTQGVFSISGQPTALEIISRSGGFNLNADKTNVLVIRKQQNGSTVLNLNLKKALQGDKTQDIFLMKDDIVYVPSDTNKLIVLGEVSTPGGVGLEKEISDAPMSLLEVIAKAGGFKANADKSGVVIIRKEGELTEIKKYNVKKALEKGDRSQNVTVLKGDIVFVPKIEQRIIVTGEVTTPGAVTFDRPLHIIELLSKSGGFNSNANKNNVLIIRNDNDKSQLIPIDIERALEKGDPNQNLVLQNGDIVYVPRDNKRVIVLGEIKTPGNYSYITPITLLDAISKSGGLLNTANEEKIIIVRQGAVKVMNLKSIYKKGDLEQNIILQNGDIVYAPTTFIADVESVLQHITTIFGSFTSVASPIILWPQVKSAIEGKSNTTTISIPVGAGSAGSSN